MTTGRQKRTGDRRGFTLIEMSVVVGIIGLITAITLPAFSSYLRRERITGLRNQMVSDIYYARSLAIANRRTFAMQIQEDRYLIVDTSDGSVTRTIMTPRGLTLEAPSNPNFYAWGLADAVDITLTGSHETKTITLMPTGAVEHD